jgi:ATP-dependent helicase Lhr and Lhr-like helicase
VVWTGAGALAGTDGWVALAPAELAPQLLPQPDAIDDPLQQAVLEALGGDAAMFFRSLADRVGEQVAVDPTTGEVRDRPSDDDVAAAVWQLVWAGLLTNDTLAPVRALLGGGRTGGGRSAARTAHSTRRRPPRPRYGRYGGLAGIPTSSPRTAPPTMGGRWSATAGRDDDPTRRALTAAETLLDRYGVVTRGAVTGERISGGFAAVYPVLKAAEESGRVRRGYFVDGLGAAQFALPGAVDRLRNEARPDDTREPAPATVLAATDPANPYGAALAWPHAPAPEGGGGRGHQPARKAGALVVLVDGACVLYVERGGRTLLSFSDSPAELQPAADALALSVRDGALGKLAVERADGAPVLSSPLGQALEAAGFRPTPRGLRMRS